jgi:enamine deaminase RidA (YjgF/YER057c/UK114 family)
LAPEGIEAQTEQALVNLAAVLQAAGASMAGVVKTTIFYDDVEDFGRLNEVYVRHMRDPPSGPFRAGPHPVAPWPARLDRGDCLGADHLSPCDAGIELETGQSRVVDACGVDVRGDSAR